MRVQVLHIDACPNWRETRARTRQALDALGQSAMVEAVLIASEADAAATAFAGSPTIVADGADLFPSAEATNDLACRVYATPSGLAGSPTITQIEGALRARLDHQRP